MNPRRVLVDILGAATEDLGDLYRPPLSPWLRVNMVTTADGAATGSSGTSGSINNPADKAVFDVLRGQADAILVGAGTARVEEYRVAAVPLVLVTRSGEVPAQLRDAPPGKVLLALSASCPGLARAREVVGPENVVVAGEHEVDLGAVRAELLDRGFSQVLGEGGPHLLRGLLAAGVVDELCLTTVPLLVGGSHHRIVQGPELDVDLELAVLLEQDGTLLARYLVAGRA